MTKTQFNMRGASVTAVIVATALFTPFFGAVASASAVENGASGGATASDEIGGLDSVTEHAPQTDSMNGQLKAEGFLYYKDHPNEIASVVLKAFEKDTGKLIYEGPFQADSPVPPGHGSSVWENHGFAPIISIAAGTYTVAAFGSASGKLLGEHEVTVKNASAVTPPVGAAVKPKGTGNYNVVFLGENKFRVDGWLRNKENPKKDVYNVRVELDGKRLDGPLKANGPTPPLGPSSPTDDGYAPSSGFTKEGTASVGKHKVCAYDAETGVLINDCKDFEVTGKPISFGIDVNKAQKGIDFEQVKRDGAQFVIVKLGGFNVFNEDNDHTPYVAPTYAGFVSGARKAALPIGHMYVTGKVVESQTVEKQAKFFVDHLVNFDKDHDVLALDNEKIDDNGELWTDAKAAGFINEVIRLTGIPANRVWFYVGANDARNNAPWTQVNKLIADDGVGKGVRVWWAARGESPASQTPDHTPELKGSLPWWDIHQFTNQAPVAGKKVDGNVTIRTVEDLFNLTPKLAQ